MSGQHDAEFEAVQQRTATHHHAGDGHDHGPVHEDPAIQRMAMMGLPAGAPNSVVARAVVQRQEEEEELQMRRDPGRTIQRQEEEEELQMRRDPGLTVQRQEEEEELQMRRDPGRTIQRQEEEEELQMLDDGTGARQDAPDHAEMVQRATSGGGQPIDDSLRPQLEQHVGDDLTGVNVHTGAAAAEAAASLGAEAFTVGNDMVFGAGKYDPESDSGAHRIAHEAQHVVQQRSGPVSATDTGTGVAVSDPADSFETEAESLASTFRRR